MKIVNSCESTICKILIACNILLGIFFINRYNSVFDKEADQQCLVAGADTVYWYAYVVGIPLGISPYVLFVVGKLMKLPEIFGFLCCSECVLRCKKRMRGIPEDFEHLREELLDSEEEDEHASKEAKE